MPSGAELAQRRAAPARRRVPARAWRDDDGRRCSPAGCSRAGRCGRCATSPRPRAACRARTSASGSGSRDRRTSSASWPTRSTGCSSGSTPRSRASATSSPTPRTSCARRWRSCAPRSTWRWRSRMPDVSELRAMGEAVRETIDRCERLIEALLMLARSEAAAAVRRRWSWARWRRTASRTCGPARRRPRSTMSGTSCEPAWTRGDPALLERMIANLIENGIRHNEHGGAPVRVDVDASAIKVRVVVSNGGADDRPGGGAQADRAVPPPRAWDGRARARAFDRALGGPGPRRHGGDRSAADAGGLEVRVELPATAGKPKVNVAEESRALTRK